jgi:glycosyltransferase involved in cell wall biosynthesis
MEEDRVRFAEAGVRSNLILHGYHPPSQLGEFFERFDVCVAPYQRTVAVSGGGDTSAYISPLKIFEYMAWAKPILSSDLPVLREVLVDGYNAVLLPPDEVGAWATALRRLMISPEECRRLGSPARAEFVRRYTWRERARQVLAGVEVF